MDRLEKESHFQSVKQGVPTKAPVDQDAVCSVCLARVYLFARGAINRVVRGRSDANRLTLHAVSLRALRCLRSLNAALRSFAQLYSLPPVAVFDEIVRSSVPHCVYFGRPDDTMT